MKKINKLFATIISGTLLFSSVGTTAFAEDLSTNETPFYTYEEIQNMSDEEFLAIGDNQDLYNSILYLISQKDDDNNLIYYMDYIRIPKDCYVANMELIGGGFNDCILSQEYKDNIKTVFKNNDIIIQREYSHYKDSYTYIYDVCMVNSNGDILFDKNNDDIYDNTVAISFPNNDLYLDKHGNKEENAEDLEYRALNSAKSLFTCSQIFGEVYFSCEKEVKQDKPFYTHTEIKNMSAEKFLSIDNNQALYDSILSLISQRDDNGNLIYSMDYIRIPKNAFRDEYKNMFGNNLFLKVASDAFTSKYADAMRVNQTTDIAYVDMELPYTDRNGEVCKEYDTCMINSNGDILLNKNNDDIYNNTVAVNFFQTNFYLDKNGTKKETAEDLEYRALNSAKSLYSYIQIFGEVYFSCETKQSNQRKISGDVNMDGKIGLRDALALNRLIVQAANGNELNEYQKVSADCYSDGKIDTADSVILLQYLVGMHKTLPVKPE